MESINRPYIVSNSALALLTAAVLIAGCAAPLKKAPTTLAIPRMSPDSCVLDVFFVRVPFGDPRVNDTVWKEIDEQVFSTALRRRLMRNGLRVGVVDGQMPSSLANLLELNDKPPPTDDVKGTNLNDLNKMPVVMRRHMQVRASEPSEIIASGIYDQLPVLVSESGEVNGETFDQAQGVFNIKTYPLPDGRVRVDLLPEVHHDQARQHWVAEQGMMRLDSSRPKKTFEELAISASLSPGGILVMTSLSNHQGSLGHYFFTEDNGRLEQKLLVLRVSQTQHDDLFSAAEPAPAE
ncbi:MAG: hypothetical protein ACWGMZ_00165 [Thermoguttaceae bacterium]